MEYCFLKRFVMVLLIQHCSSEGLSSAVQSSTVVTLQDGHDSPQEELPPAYVVPMVPPPSLEEVQLVVQEASQQVDSRGAEEVLKELLERVVEAALTQVEGGGVAKADAAELLTAEAEAMGTEKGGTETESKVLEQAVEEDAAAEDTAITGGAGAAEEKLEVSEGNAIEDVAEEERGVEGEGEAETGAGSVEETKAGVETGGSEAENEGVINESLDTDVSREVEEKATSDEIGGNEAVEEAGVEDEDQVELSEEREAAETHMQEIEEAPAVVGAAVGSDSELETVVESDPTPSADDVEQIGDVQEEKESQEGETQVDQKEGELIVPLSHNYEMESTQSVIVEPIEQGDVIKKEDSEGPERKNEQGLLVVEGGAAEEVEGDRAAGEAEGGERHGESVIKEQSVVSEGLGDQQAAEEEQIALETLNGSEEDKDVVLVSAPEPDDSADASMEKTPGNLAPTTGPSQVGVEAKENTLGNEIIPPTEDLLEHHLVMAQPTLDNFVKDVLTEPPQAEGEEPGEAIELVEDTAGGIDTSELSLEAWKIGAISATVFLVLETTVIIIYILHCRNKKSRKSLQRACEEGCVEPEAATRGDCSDDTLPAGNGNTQQIAALDPSDVASTLDQNKEQHEGEHVIAMSDLLPSSTEQSADTGPGSDSSQDLRTSIL